MQGGQTSLENIRLWTSILASSSLYLSSSHSSEKIVMRSLDESRRRWEVTTRHASTLKELKKSVRSDGEQSPCKAGLRSVCWKTFLLFQTTEFKGWSKSLLDSRSAYTSLRGHLLRYIDNPGELGSTLDPLDDDRHSPWTTLRQDEEIRAEIFQDVERCMPEDPYFRQPLTQRLMLDILFIFCKINQDIGYRQGMHEILAPILWVVEQDAIDYGKAGELSPDLENDALLKQTLDPMYIEHDAFTILSLIMRTAKSFYELGEPDRRSSTASMGTATSQPAPSPIVERSKRIHEVYLASLDPELAKHLTEIEVLPQIFLIRWIRLLFGREFPFDDLLALWDILLAEDPALDLVDMVCVAMLLRIRWQLIEADYSVALMLLLKYPSPSPPNGPQTFVDDAIYLRDNFSATGGNEIIFKYSGKQIPQTSSTARSLTTVDLAMGSKQNLSRTRSPLSSPARFLQQQGGVEALLQGAARGVFDRGERLGINQAVRDAVGEVKKNMQGLQTPRPNSITRRTSDVLRWSLDEGRSAPSKQPSLVVMNKRNLQLARMLDQAMTDLRAASVSSEGDIENCIKAMDLAIAKVDFVKIYLEDSTMPLPTEESRMPPDGSSTPEKEFSPQSPPIKPESATKSKASKTIIYTSVATVDGSSLARPPTTNSISINEIPALSIATDLPLESGPLSSGSKSASANRPMAPVPTRSTIANSSFSWMLESDVSTISSTNSSPPKSTSPFLKSGKRPTSGREKAAFLFGDDGAESISAGGRQPSLADTEDIFKLGTIRGSKDK